MSMKKLVLILTFVSISLAAFSQVTFKPGVKAGVNFAKVSNTIGDTKTDFYVGGLLEMQFANFYALQPELLYSRQGNDHPVSGYDGIELQYFSISIANKFSPFKDIGLNFVAGPSIDIKVGDNIDNDDWSPLDFAVFGGLSYEFPFGLEIEARYKQGLIDIDDGYSEFGNSDADDNNLNSVIQVGLSYKFSF